MDFVYRFPVVKGVQATREYYIAMIPLKIPYLIALLQRHCRTTFMDYLRQKLTVGDQTLTIKHLLIAFK